MIQIEHKRDQDLIVVRASGRLTLADYHDAMPEIDTAVQLAGGPLQVMIRLEDFHGWDIGALWQELRFDAEYGGDFERVAVLGETSLEGWATRLAAPFVRAEMRFFPRADETQALAWLRNG
jgi:hypothetical protein